MNNATNISLYSSSQGLQARLHELAQLLSLSISEHMSDDYDYFLVLEPHPEPPGYCCYLQQTGAKAPGPVMVDFTRGQAAHRRQFGGGRKQPLARAVGMRPGHNPSILDVTGGLGRDAFVLASLGCHVTLLERQPVIMELLNNGITRARYHTDTAEIVSRMTLIHADAHDYLQSISKETTPDVIYLDPMYPPRDKTALVKKEMRYFHDIAGRDDDATQLLINALSTGARRIVVKRPARAQPLSDNQPDTVVSSKNTHYDIYLHH